MSYSKSAVAGHLAAAGAYIIFGLNILFTKDLSKTIGLSPVGIFSLRAIGAAILFWAISLFTPREKSGNVTSPR